MKKLMVVWVLLASFCSVGYSAVTAQYVRFEIPVQPYVGVSGFSYEIVDLKEIQIFANGSTNNISLGKTVI